MTDDEGAAIALLIGHLVDGRDVTPREVAVALAVLAQKRPWSMVGRAFFLAAARRNLAAMAATPRKEKP
ncbi:MAG: hypothetical protein U1F54_23055 [Burkholderiales bacterium]